MKWSKNLIISVISMASLNATADVPKNMDVISQQAELMSGVLTKAMNSEQATVSRISSTYLVDQGLVFDIRLVNTRNMRFFNPVMEPPEPPEVEGVEELVEEAMEVAMQALEEQEIELHLEFSQDDEEYHQLREKLHLSREREREINRQEREIERQKIRAPKSEVAELEKREKALVKDKKALEKDQEKLKAKIKEHKMEVSKRRAEVRAKKLQAWRETLIRAESQLMDGLCSFGGGLRPLPKDQYASFVLKNGSDDRKRDKVYVLERKDIMNCVIGEIDAKGLLSKAQTYLF